MRTVNFDGQAQCLQMLMRLSKRLILLSTLRLDRRSANSTVSVLQMRWWDHKCHSLPYIPSGNSPHYKPQCWPRWHSTSNTRSTEWWQWALHSRPCRISSSIRTTFHLADGSLEIPIGAPFHRTSTQHSSTISSHCPHNMRFWRHDSSWCYHSTNKRCCMINYPSCHPPPTTHSIDTCVPVITLSP